MADPKPQKSTAQTIPLVEYLMGGVGLCIVAAALGFLIYEGTAGDQSEPDVGVELREVTPIQHGYRVKFEARNHGGKAAAHLVIEGVLRREGEQLEKSEANIDYLPAHSTRTGGLFFQNDPRTATWSLRAVGYEDP